MLNKENCRVKIRFHYFITCKAKNRYKIFVSILSISMLIYSKNSNQKANTVKFYVFCALYIRGYSGYQTQRLIETVSIPDFKNIFNWFLKEIAYNGPSTIYYKYTSRCSTWLETNYLKNKYSIVIGVVVLNIVQGSRVCCSMDRDKRLRPV